MAAESSPVVTPDFLSLVAHELTQPLTAARGSAATLTQERVRTLDADHKKLLLETILRNLDQLQSLIDSLRVFSETEGDMEVTLTEGVKVEELFADAGEDFGSPLSGATIEFECEPGLEFTVDVMLFRQVLSNLIGNAAKFSTRGSKISITAVGEEDGVLFSVHNEGAGFDPREKERIFRRSVRLESGKRGLGLGLFVSQAIVAAHDGRIWGESEPGKGATFFVWIPRGMSD